MFQKQYTKSSDITGGNIYNVHNLLQILYKCFFTDVIYQLLPEANESGCTVCF